jgi:hypothetical protein
MQLASGQSFVNTEKTQKPQGRPEGSATKKAAAPSNKAPWFSNSRTFVRQNRHDRSYPVMALPRLDRGIIQAIIAGVTRTTTCGNG